MENSGAIGSMNHLPGVGVLVGVGGAKIGLVIGTLMAHKPFYQHF